MNPPASNREPPFTLPDDGWYNIEAKGLHPNVTAGVVQVIDDDACRSIVNRFNAEADKPGFAGMLIDHEHFKHDENKETSAYGWLTALQNRSDGIYGKIRWSTTGRQAVEGGDYRFFSTEYDSNDLQILSDKKPRRVRPLRLDGLTLTNVNNNKGQKPITNRQTMTTPEISKLSQKAMQATQKAHSLGSYADTASDHEAAAAAHIAAAQAHELLGHTNTAKSHLESAQSHSKTAEIIKRGVPDNPSALADADGDDAGTTANREAVASGQLRIEAEKLAAATGRKFAECWDQLLAANPARLPLLNRGAADAQPVEDLVRPGSTLVQLFHMGDYSNSKEKIRVANSCRESSDAPLSLADLDDAISEYRVTNRCKSYGEARNGLRAKHPGFFGA